MAVNVTEQDKKTLVPYGLKGEKISIAEMVQTKEFKSLHPVFAENILKMVRENPSIGILQGGADRSEEQVRQLFYSNYKPLDKAITFEEYDSDPKKYNQIKKGIVKWNPEDKRWYKLATKKVVAVPGASWHTGGFAVDFTGNTTLAGKIAKNYNIEQITSTGEKHHFQPAGIPTSKRMYQLIKERFGVDAIETPLPKQITEWLDSEVASNVPRQPERVMKKLGTLVNSWKDTGVFPSPKSVKNDGSVTSNQPWIISKVTRATEPPVKTTTTTTPPTTTMAPTTTVKPTTTTASPTTTVPSTTTTRPSTTTTNPPTTTTTKPKKTTTTTVASEAVTTDPKTGLPLDKNGNVVKVVVPPNETIPKATTTTTTVPPTTTTVGTTTTTAPEQVASVRSGPTGADISRFQGVGTSMANTKSNSKKSKSGSSGAGSNTVDVGGKKVKVGSDAWKEIIQEEFGGLWDVYNDNAEVKKVIDQSVKEGWFNDENKLTASLRSTNWYRTTEQSARQYAIQLSTDPATLEDRIVGEIDALRAESLKSGLTFDDVTLRRLATSKVKYGWTDQQVANAVGSEAVSLAKAGGAKGIEDLRQGNVAIALRKKANAYAQKPSNDVIDAWVQDIMTGRKTDTQWDEFMRNSAKTQFRSLAPAIDRGDDVETAMYAYKQQAVNTLGSAIDATQIDWTSDKWNKAMNYKDPKTNEYRQMDLWEWNKYLRTLPEWQETEDAKQVYRNVAYSLAKGFGKMA